MPVADHFSSPLLVNRGDLLPHVWRSSNLQASAINILLACSNPSFNDQIGACCSAAMWSGAQLHMCHVQKGGKAAGMPQANHRMK